MAGFGCQKLIFGCGYLGRRVAQKWVDRGETVYAVTRSHRRADELRRAGLSAVVADVTKPETLVGLPQVTTVLFAVGFDRTAGSTIRQVYVNGLQNALSALTSGGCVIERFIYTSSTGVYGQRNGEWVDECSPCHPTRLGGKSCLAAEQVLAAHAVGERTVILRLAGIYGPDRVPRQRDLQQRKQLPVFDGYLNLIHVDDAANVVLAAESYTPGLGELPATASPYVFVVADGTPVKRRAYYTELAQRLKLNVPDFCDPDDVSQSVDARRMGNKRVRTLRLMRELKPNLNYPSFREGLAEIRRRGC